MFFLFLYSRWKLSNNLFQWYFDIFLFLNIITNIAENFAYISLEGNPSGRKGIPPQVFNVKLNTSFETSNDTYRCQMPHSHLNISQLYHINYIWLFNDKIITGYSSINNTLENHLPESFANKVKRGTKVCTIIIEQILVM